ncbi:heterokaryon incompatibility protein-domain-containing protein, partial [Lophiotrema nucula]
MFRFTDITCRPEAYCLLGEQGPLSVSKSTSPVVENPQSEECIDQVKAWIDRCERTHQQCKTQEPSSLPIRVINVGSADGSVGPCLYISKGESGKYAALSHCWGLNGPKLTTRRETLDRRKCGIDWSDIPKSFQDAIIVTRYLGLKYLWIDSLCILQGDAEDWAQESGKMASIYGSAYVVISATSAKGSETGFLSSRPDDCAIKLKLGTDGATYSVFARPAILHTPFLGAGFQERRFTHPDYPLLERAWCFQERLLATRVLHFTRGETVFECKAQSYCECGYLAGNNRFTYKSEDHNFRTGQRDYPLEDLWQDLVRIYTAHSLTYQTDVLSAFSGIAKSMEPLRMGDYLAGLWSTQLL